MRSIESMDTAYFLKSEYFVIDFENTGGSLAEGHKITAVGICVVKPRRGRFRITRRFSTLVNPEREIPEFIEKLIGIKTAQVNSSRYPKIEKIFGKMEKLFNNDKIFVAHGGRFDYSMYNYLYFQKYKRNLFCVSMDTHKLAKRIFDIRRANIGNIAELFELTSGKQHEPDFDSFVASQVLMRALRLLERKPLLLADFKSSVTLCNG